MIRKLFNLMYKEKGIGLAAPQVGINQRIMVFNEFEGNPSTEIALINPKVS